MRSRHKLRFRLVVSFALFGFGLSALFAVTLFKIRSRIEDQLINNSLLNQVDNLNAQVRANPGRAPRVDMIRAWSWGISKLHKAPLAWQHLASGVHDITETNASGQIRHYKLAVKRLGGVVSFIRYDVTREEQGKRQLMAYVIIAVFLFGLLSLAIGLWLSRKVVKPVMDLAGRLREARKVQKVELLAPHFADDEVGELAQALDAYAERLTAMVERDREFNSDVSHELRTPLAVIVSTTELMQDSSDLTPKLIERLKRIERAARQATELIEALLWLSRAERRGMAQGETTDVGKVARDVIENQYPQVRSKPISIELSLNSQVNVYAPNSVLAVALTNLIGNAIKYTLKGSVRIEVGQGRVEVIDTGSGIGYGDAERLFQRGFRGGNATGSGAGLGLAIVRRLCDLYGWKVSMRPRMDVHGTIASIVFDQEAAPRTTAQEKKSSIQ